MPARHACRAVLLALVFSVRVPTACAAVFAVDSTQDSPDAAPADGTCADALGRCTLRAAVDEARSGDTVSIPAGTYVLMSELQLSRDVTLEGAGRDATLVSQPGSGFVVRVDSCSPVLRGLTVQGTSDMAGGTITAALAAPDRLVLDQCALVQGMGVGVEATGGAVEVRGSRIENVERDGVLVTGGSLEMTDSTVASIGYGLGSDGAGIHVSGATSSALVQRCEVRDAFGGGILIEGAAAQVSDSRIVDNGGAAGGGGVLASLGAQVTLSRCLVSGNHGALFGHGAGGVFASSGARLRVVDCTIASNVCQAQGDSGPNQTADFGGGAGAEDAELDLVNCTLQDNDVYAQVGQFGVDPPLGGGVRALPGSTVTLLSTTVVSRWTSRPVGADGIHADAGAVLRIGNCILAGASNADASGDIVSLGCNLVQRPGSARFTGATSCLQLGIAPALSSFGDHGGTLSTFVPLAGSPALDAADPAGCLDDTGAPLATDQRGEPRPFDADGDGVSRCDLGAVEAQSFDLNAAAPPMSGDLRVSRRGASAVLAWSDDPGAGVTSHDVARDTLARLRGVARRADAPCVTQAEAGSEWLDDTAAGTDGLYWLVRARNDAGAGSWGTDSFGAGRPACP